MASLIMNLNCFFLGAVVMFFSCTQEDTDFGQTEITKWQGGKQSAVSITYDDGTINQFTVARPIMNKLDLPGTFYIITGKIKGAAGGRFIGRPRQEIIKETATVETNQENFFERASLIGYTGMEGGVDYHTRAGSLFESGEVQEAYALIDEAFELVRKQSALNPEEQVFHDNPVDTTTWEEYQSYAAEGHEIASHTVTHPRLAVLDEPNMLYELEQSKADIRKFLGDTYTFSAECPYGTENERVMDYAYEIYPALRNRMPEAYLDELNRSSQRQPGESDKEYVQWQRGPLTDISMEAMKSWVDTCLVHDNIWLVLVFHGVDGVGWEPRTGAELEEYFNYIKERESNLWVATFADVTKYIRERKNTTIMARVKDDTVLVDFSCNLDQAVYNVPLTFKTYVPGTWKEVLVKTADGQEVQFFQLGEDDTGPYALYSVSPGQGKITLYEG